MVVVQPYNTLACNENDSKKFILPCPSRWWQAMRLPLRNQDGVKKWATGSTSSNTDVNGNQNRQCSNLGPSDTTSTKAKPKKRQKRSREEYKEILYCFYCALENPTLNGKNQQIVV